MVDIRESRSDDRDAILELSGIVLGEESANALEREWDWRWREDPRLDAPGPRGPVLESEGRIVGSTALIPAGLFVGGEPVESWWRVDTIVHPEFRRRGLAALMTEHMPRVAILGKGVTGASLALLLKCGYDQIETGGYWVRTLSLKPRLARLAGDAAGALLGAMVDPFVRGAPEVPERLAPLDGDFDERFDELWSASLRAYPSISRRDAATLNWRYRRRPGWNYEVLVHADGGYVVFYTFERRGILRGRIADLLARPRDSAALDELLAGALAALARAGADRADCFATSPVLHDALLRAGFKPSFGKDPLFLRDAGAEGIYLTAGDGDGA